MHMEEVASLDGHLIYCKLFLNLKIFNHQLKTKQRLFLVPLSKRANNLLQIEIQRSNLLPLENLQVKKTTNLPSLTNASFVVSLMKKSLKETNWMCII